MTELYQIYLITNIINNKKYVGQVVQHRGYLLRFKEHLQSTEYANTRYLSNAINKYGTDAFIVELIEDNIPESEIDDKEKFYIDKYNTFYTNNLGYNMTHGGQGVHGYEHTNDDKLKIRYHSKQLWKDLKNDPQRLYSRNKKISDKLKGHSKSEEHKANLSKAAKKRFENEPGTFTGKHHSEETKEKLRKYHIKNYIAMLDKNTGEELMVFESSMQAAKYVIDNNITKNMSAFTRILSICKGKGKTAYGYIWKFK